MILNIFSILCLCQISHSWPTHSGEVSPLIWKLYIPSTKHNILGSWTICFCTGLLRFTLPVKVTLVWCVTAYLKYRLKKISISCYIIMWTALWNRWKVLHTTHPWKRSYSVGFCKSSFANHNLSAAQAAGRPLVFHVLGMTEDLRFCHCHFMVNISKYWHFKRQPFIFRAVQLQSLKCKSVLDLCCAVSRACTNHLLWAGVCSWTGGLEVT